MVVFTTVQLINGVPQRLLKVMNDGEKHIQMPLIWYLSKLNTRPQMSNVVGQPQLELIPQNREILPNISELGFGEVPDIPKTHKRVGAITTYGLDTSLRVCGCFHCGNNHINNVDGRNDRNSKCEPQHNLGD
jgi:hypothetical protein